MEFYRYTGFLVLGTWFKRLSEKYLREIGTIYKGFQINFEPAWFPIFYILQRGEKKSITSIAKLLDISHSAVSQMVNNLIKNHLIVVVENPEDFRIKEIQLSVKGKELLNDLQPIWNGIEEQLKHLWPNIAERTEFVTNLNRLDEFLSNKELSNQVLKNAKPVHISIEELDAQSEIIKEILAYTEFKTPAIHHNDIVLMAHNSFKNLGILILSPLKKKGNYLIKNLFVLPDSRRQGVSKKLLEKAVLIINSNEQITFVLKGYSTSVILTLLQLGYPFSVLNKKKNN